MEYIDKTSVSKLKGYNRTRLGHGSIRSGQLSSSLPASSKLHTRNQDGFQKVRNSVNSADLFQDDRANSFFVLGKKTSVSAYSKSNGRSRDDSSSKQQAHGTEKPPKQKLNLDNLSKSLDVCHSNLITTDGKKGSSKGKSQLTLYINSRPPNGECDTAHEVSIEDNNSRSNSIGKSRQNSVDIVQIDRALLNRDIGNELAMKSGENIPAALLSPSQTKSSKSLVLTQSLAIDNEKNYQAQAMRNDPDTIRRETVGSDRDCQVTEGQFSEQQLTQQTFHMAEMEIDDGIGALTDPIGTQLDTEAKEQTNRESKRQMARLPTKIGKVGRIKSEMVVQVGVGEYDYKTQTILGYNESVYTAHTGSTNRLSIKKDTQRLSLCVHRKKSIVTRDKKSISQNNLMMISNQRDLTKANDIDKNQSFQKLTKLKMAAWPVRKKLLANPQNRQFRYQANYDSKTQRVVPKAKARDRQALQGNSLQPLRSNEQQIEINDYSQNSGHNSYYQMINQFTSNQDSKTRQQRIFIGYCEINVWRMQVKGSFFSTIPSKCSL